MTRPLGRSTSIAATLAALAAVGALAVAPTAVGDDGSASTAASALSDAGATDASASTPVPTDNGLVAATSDATVSLPADASGGVTIDPASGAPVTVGLPAASGDAVPVSNGIAAYQDGSDAEVAVQVLPDDASLPTSDPQPDTATATTETTSTAGADDGQGIVSTTTDTTATLQGGARLMTILEDPSAPTEYDFPLSVPSGGQIVPTLEGGYVVEDADGVELVAVAPAWAQDAAGNAVPAWYTLDGTTLQLHVDPTGASYPVVADPTTTAVSTCKTASVTDNYTNAVGVKLMSFALSQYFCANGKSVTSVGSASASPNVTTAGGLLAWQYDRIISSTDQYQSWEGQSTGEHLTRRQASFKRCVTWLCIGQWLPTVTLYEYGNGSAQGQTSG